jgi:hypothetical protein
LLLLLVVVLQPAPRWLLQTPQLLLLMLQQLAAD